MKKPNKSVMYAKMYLVTPMVYEKLKTCLDKSDISNLEKINRPFINTNQLYNYPSIPPNQPPSQSLPPTYPQYKPSNPFNHPPSVFPTNPQQSESPFTPLATSQTRVSITPQQTQHISNIPLEISRQIGSEQPQNITMQSTSDVNPDISMRSQQFWDDSYGTYMHSPINWDRPVEFTQQHHQIQEPARSELMTRPEHELQNIGVHDIATQQISDIAVPQTSAVALRPETAIESNPMVVPVEDRPPPTDIAVPQSRVIESMDEPMMELPQLTTTTTPSLAMEFYPTSSMTTSQQPSITNRRRTIKALTLDPKKNLKGVVKKRPSRTIRNPPMLDLSGDIHASHYGEVLTSPLVQHDPSISDPYRAVVRADAIPLPQPGPRVPELVYKIPENVSSVPNLQSQQDFPTLTKSTSFPVAIPTRARQEEIENIPEIPQDKSKKKGPKYIFKYTGPPLPPVSQISLPVTRGSKRTLVEEPIGPPGKYLTYENPILTVPRSIPGINQCDLCGKILSSKFNLNRHRNQELQRLNANQMKALEYKPESDFVKWLDEKKKIQEIEEPIDPKPGSKRTSTDANLMFYRLPKRKQTVQEFPSWVLRRPEK